MKKVKAQLGARAKKKPTTREIAAVVGQLFLVGEHLPNKLRRKILDLGPAAVPFLIELLFDPKAAEEPIPGPGLFPLHAAVLLGELRAQDAVIEMQAFREFALEGSPIARALDEALARIAAPADADAPDVEPVAAADDDDPRAALLALARKLAGG
jgi:hypothetical protein